MSDGGIGAQQCSSFCGAAVSYLAGAENIRYSALRRNNKTR